VRAAKVFPDDKRIGQAGDKMIWPKQQGFHHLFHLALRLHILVLYPSSLWPMGCRLTFQGTLKKLIEAMRDSGVDKARIVALASVPINPASSGSAFAHARAKGIDAVTGRPLGFHEFRGGAFLRSSQGYPPGSTAAESSKVESYPRRSNFFVEFHPIVPQMGRNDALMLQS